MGDEVELGVLKLAFPLVRKSLFFPPDSQQEMTESSVIQMHHVGSEVQC